jgi:DNA-binding transcriptional LysR family regulator
MENWHLWQSVLYAANSSSLGAAARQLQIDPTTLSRKIKRLENRIGHQLFERHGVSLKPTAYCLSLLPQLERAATGIAEIEASFSAGPAYPPRTIRISTLAMINAHILSPALPKLLEGHNLLVDLQSQNQNVLVTRREADIALRLAKPLQQGIDAEQIGDVKYLPVAAKNADLQKLRWASLSSAYSHLPEVAWTLKQPGAKSGIHFASEMESILQMVRIGAAKALLPSFMLAGQTGLVEISRAPPLTRPLWLLRHKDDRGTGYIETVCNWIKSVV